MGKHSYIKIPFKQMTEKLGLKEISLKGSIVLTICYNLQFIIQTIRELIKN